MKDPRTFKKPAEYLLTDNEKSSLQMLSGQIILQKSQLFDGQENLTNLVKARQALFDSLLSKAGMTTADVAPDLSKLTAK